MAEIDKHKPGAFNWIELSTKDQNGAKSFYTSLFGWTSTDFPMGPDDFYTMFALKGRTCAAVYTMREDEQQMHIPSHWNLYIQVESADDTAKRAAELGAKVLAPPFDISTHGRTAVIQDPAGAVFMLWQPNQHRGIALKDEPGRLLLGRLEYTRPAGCRCILREALRLGTGSLEGWLRLPAHQKRRGLHRRHSAKGIPEPNAPPHWMIYLQVSDCDATTAKAKELGAQVYMGPMTMEKVGRITVFADPQEPSPPSSNRTGKAVSTGFSLWIFCISQAKTPTLHIANGDVAHRRHHNPAHPDSSLACSRSRLGLRGRGAACRFSYHFTG